ncbi:hypothetical protein [Halopiger djelfimassiliensis]|uniref:hypothetical protein n=1 Tax=Halopiger djelfimassiliensis TaxID=1293047 RepID=UPI000677B05C|nr:hypothetical protein [Halopiger djelfimassiliensis]
MKREYRYTIYVLALAAAITVATGVIVATGDASTHDTTEASLENVTIELADEDDALTDDQAERLPELVWENDDVRRYFDDPDALAFEVSQRMTYDESADAVVPREDTVKVHVSPAGERLPYLFATVDLDAGTVSVQNGIRTPGDIDVEVSDENDLLTAAERERVAKLLLDDPDVEWESQTLLGGPETLAVEITDRTDENVTVSVTAPDEDRPAIRATVALQNGAVEIEEYDTPGTAIELDAVNVTETNTDSTTIGGGQNNTIVYGSDDAETLQLNVTDGNGSAADDESGSETGTGTTTNAETEPKLDLDDVDLEITDENDLLTDDERDLLENLVVDDPGVRSSLQRQFDDPDELGGTVSRAETFDAETGEFVERDDIVKVALAPPTVDDEAVVSRIDLENETVTQTHTKVTLDSVENDYEITIEELDGHS